MVPFRRCYWIEYNVTRVFYIRNVVVESENYRGYKILSDFVNVKVYAA